MFDFLLFGPSIFYFAHVLLSHTRLVTLLCSFSIHQMYGIICIRSGEPLQPPIGWIDARKVASEFMISFSEAKPSMVGKVDGWSTKERKLLDIFDKRQ